MSTETFLVYSPVDVRGIWGVDDPAGRVYVAEVTVEAAVYSDEVW